MRFAIAIVSALFLVGSSAASVSEESQIVPTEVAYCELAKDAKSFVGKRIRIRAIYRHGFELQRLEPPQCCPGPPIKIWVKIEAGLEGRSQKLFRKIDNGQGTALVVFIGRFDSGGSYGTFGDRFQLTVNEIEKVEKTSKSSRRQDDPSWVPKNCDPPKTQ
jgi:hypothetical protein